MSFQASLPLSFRAKSRNLLRHDRQSLPPSSSQGHGLYHPERSLSRPNREREHFPCVLESARSFTPPHLPASSQQPPHTQMLTYFQLEGPPKKHATFQAFFRKQLGFNYFRYKEWKVARKPRHPCGQAERNGADQRAKRRPIVPRQINGLSESRG